MNLPPFRPDFDATGQHYNAARLQLLEKRTEKLPYRDIPEDCITDPDRLTQRNRYAAIHRQGKHFEDRGNELSRTCAAGKSSRPA